MNVKRKKGRLDEWRNGLPFPFFHSSILPFIVVTFFLSNISYSQQLQFYSSYFDYPLLYNPSFAGNDYHTNIGLLHRSQFTGFQGSPVMNLIVADSKLQKRKAYTGGFISNQHKGIFNNTQAQALYAYRLNFNEETFLKFGISLGILDQNINYSSVIVQNYTDPNLFLSNQHKAGLDANAGISFYLKGLQAGFSVPSLLGQKLNYKDYANTRSYYAMSRHYTASLRYDICVNKNKEIFISPFFLTRFVVNAPVQFDGGIMFDWRDKFRVGAFYRSSYAVTANAAITLNRRLTLSYCYDIAVGSIGTYGGLTHEISFNFKIGKLKPKPNEDSLDPMERKVVTLEKEVMQLKDEMNKKKTGNAGMNTEQNNSQGQNATNNNTGKQDSKRTTVKQNGINVVTDNHSNYQFSTGNEVPKGFYVVVGSYFYKDYAESEVKRYVSFGFPDADAFINKRDKFYYVYIYKAESKQEAFIKAADAKMSGVPDVWIEILTE